MALVVKERVVDVFLNRGTNINQRLINVNRWLMFWLMNYSAVMLGRDKGAAMRWMCTLFLAACSAQAAIYRCPQADGRVAFSDRPCDGAAESQGRQIEVHSPPVPTPPAGDVSDAKWEEARRFRFVDIPAIEREAAALMASPDPAQQALGGRDGLAGEARQISIRAPG